MAGAHAKYRHLSRSSAHRKALLRNLVTSLFRHEQIKTTWHKAKEAQRLADKVVTLAKKNTPAARIRAQQIFFTPHELLEKTFGEIRERYATRPGGYTRVLRIEPLKEDQAPSAILELVDSPKDIRFAMTAQTIVRHQKEHTPETQYTRLNKEKVLKFRGEDGKKDLARMVEYFRKLTIKESLPPKETVYPDPMEPKKGRKGPILKR
ncbi:ribosomal protein L17 [Saccharata proteae CBS 121410]|uniref:Large ribosomal subunit protein bL17m n=1 Tax=Saccharata proteae CBS 121410 TaxID=1314787 RepID=A0A9P4LVJ4_9PEZI|nr:ribosomal protein L17 [Saccharata proteae CBS 121410]